MKMLIPLAAILSMAAAPQAQAQGQGRVTGLLRDNISLYNDSGTLIRKAPKREVKLPLTVFDVNDTGQPLVDWNGAKVFLRNSEIMTEGLSGPCTEMSQASRPSSRAITASTGVGSGMGKVSQRCVKAN
jgi:hypothetical protein